MDGQHSFDGQDLQIVDVTADPSDHSPSEDSLAPNIISVNLDEEDLSAKKSGSAKQLKKF